MATTAKVLVFKGMPAVRELGDAVIGAVGGSVLTPSGPLGGVTVRLWDQAWKLHGAIQSDANGTFRFEAVPQGAHIVSIDVPAGFVAEDAQSPVKVSKGVSEVAFRLRPSGRLAGRVVDSRGGDPLAGVDVEVVDNAGKALARAKTSATGDYEFAGLLAADYRVRVRDEA